MADTNRTDQVTGYQTTGHEWDGIEELNRPLPKWWLYSFYACVLWSLVYFVLYPSWPLVSGYTQGVLGYSQRETVAAQLEAAQEAQKQWRDQIAAKDLSAIKADPDLFQFAVAGGAVVTISNELGDPRYPTAASKIKARRIKPAIVPLADLGLSDDDTAVRVAFTKQFVPTVQGNCEFISGDSPAALADGLIARLRAESVI